MRRNRPCLVASLVQRGAFLLLLAIGAAVPAGGLDFYTITPCRIFDSRSGPPLAQGQNYSDQGDADGIGVTGTCGVPADAVAVALNVTLLGANGAGEFVVFPFGSPPPTAGVIPFAAGRTRATFDLVLLGAGGALDARATIPSPPSGHYHLILDLFGYFRVPDSPVLDGAGTVTFTEDGGPIVVASAITVTDPDSTNLQSATVTIANPQNGASEVLAATSCGGSLVVTPGLNSLSITGNEPLATYQTCLQSVTYDNTAVNVNTTARSVDFVANDGTSNSNTETATVNITNINDEPAGTDNTVNTPQATDYVFATADFGFTDPNDTPPNLLLAVKITTLPALGSLTLSNNPVVVGQFIPAADITAGNLEFTPAGVGTPYTSFTFQVQDDGGTAGGGVDLDASANTLTINVNNVNDAPEGTDNTVSTAEDTDYTFAAADFGFTDPNDTPPNNFFAVKITSLPAAGVLELSNVAVTAGQDIPVASIPNLTFTPAPGASGSPYTTFTFQVQDDGGTGGGGVDLDQSPNTMTINVTAVNDAPAGTDNTVTTSENIDYTFAAVDFGFTDPNDTPPNAFFAVKITTLPAAGVLELSNVAVTAGQDIPVGSIPNLTFTPVANANGTPYTTFTFQVQDDGGTGGGGVDLDPTPNTMTINVTSVNSAPAGTNNTVTTPEDTDYTFAAADFGFTDPNDTPPNNFFAVKITTLPAAGTLELSNVAVTAGQDIPVANIPNLTFTPASNGSGSPYTTFTFQVQDDGGTTGGGVDLDPSANTMTINVTAVNDAPAGTDNTVTALEDQLFTFTTAHFGFTDPNDTPPNVLLAVRITTLPGLGSLTLSGGAVSAGQFISATDINAGNLKFQGASNGSGSPYTTFTFQVQDDGGTSGGGVDLDASANTMTINVTPVNDAPAGTNNTVTTPEDVQYTFTTADFGFTDPNDSPANNFASVVITTLPGAGSLTLSGSGFAAGTEIPVANITAGNLRFLGALNQFGSPYATFTFQVRDDGGTANGGVNLDASANTMTINVTPVNDAPLPDNDTFDFIGNVQLEVDQDTAGTPETLETTPSTFGVIDGDADVEGDAITVSSITVGACTDNSAPFDCVNEPGVGTVHMLANGRFSWEPAPGDTGVAPAGCPAGAVDKESFTYTAIDNGSPAATSVAATVTFCRFERVWFVDPGAGAGDGTSDSPLNSLDSLDNAGGAGDSDVAGDYIFVHDGTLALNAPMEMENNQRFVGEGVGLSVPVNLNGNGSPTNLVPAGTQPQLTNATGDAIRVTTQIPLEIVGLSLASTTGNIIDLTSAAALTGAATYTIGQNTFRGAGAEGIDVNMNALTTGTLSLSILNNSWDTAGTHTGNAVDVNRAAGTLRLAFNSNTNIVSAASAVNINGGAAASTTITAFSNNTVHQNTVGSGIVISNATFDSDLGTANLQTVAFGTTLIGVSGDGVGGAGLSLGGTPGAVSFTDLDVFSAGAALAVTGTGAFTGAAGTQVTVGSGVATLSSTGGPAADLSAMTADLPINTLTSSGSGSTGVSLVNVPGTFSAGSGSSITNATGTDFNINGGNANVTYNGTITDDVGQIVAIASSTGGTKAFTGAITDGDDGDGSGISLTTNGGTTIRFSGGLVLNTGGNPAFTATGGATAVEVCDEDPCNAGATGLAINKLTTTTASALNVANTTIGANNLEFRSIASSGGGNSGIVLNATGSSGGLKVKGNGGACTSAATCTGGAIVNKTVDNVSLTNTTGTSLTRMFIDNSDNSGIRGDDLTNFTLDSSMVTNNANVADGTEANLRFFDLLGTSSITSSTISGGFEDQIRISPFDTTGTLNITGSIISNTVNAAGNGISISTSVGGDGNNNANFTLNVNTSFFDDINSTAIAVGGDDDFARTVNVTNSDFEDSNTAIHLLGSENADITFNIDNNDFLRHGLNPIQIVSGSTSTNALNWVGKVNNNRIGDGVAGVGGGTPDSGATDLHGIALEFNGDVSAIVSVTNNLVTHTDIDGIFIQSRLDEDADAQTGSLHLTLRDNEVQTPDDNSAFPFFAAFGTRVEARNTTTICLDMFGNKSASVGGLEHFQLRQRNTATFRLERLTDGDATPNEVITNMATVEAHIVAQNDAGSTADATNQTAGVTGFTETTDGFCLSPP